MIYDPDPSVRYKQCLHCNAWFPANSEYFGKNKHTKDGLRQPCNRCRSIAQGHTPAPRLIARDGMKCCTNCYRELPATLEWFSRQPTGKYGFTSICKECAAALGKQYRENNLDKNRNRYKTYYRLNRDKVQSAHRRYKAANADKIREHDKQRRNEPKRKVISQQRRARDKNLPNEFTGQDWHRCLEYFDYCCAACGNPAGLWHTIAQDHWIPVAAGGGYVATNIIPLCHATKGGEGGCNNNKSKRDPNEWLVSRFGKSKAKQIAKRIADYFESLH